MPYFQKFVNLSCAKKVARRSFACTGAERFIIMRYPCVKIHRVAAAKYGGKRPIFSKNMKLLCVFCVLIT